MLAHRRITCSFFLVPAFLALALAAGCHNCDLVEAELRSRENELHEARAEIDRLEALNQALLSELGTVRHQSPCPVPPELAGQTYTLRRICLGHGTGGYDDDHIPGDEALRVVLEPRDCDGHTIKAPGSVHIDVLQVTAEGLKAPLCSWDVGEQDLRSRWHCGIFCTGYILVLPWKTWPVSDKLRVVAQFRLADGRLFEADRDICIRLPPGGHCPLMHGIPPGDGPHLTVPEGDQKVPMPRPVHPENTQEVQPAVSWQRPAPRALDHAVRFLPPETLPGGY
jgi:hypothetical protein